MGIPRRLAPLLGLAALAGCGPPELRPAAADRDLPVNPGAVADGKASAASDAAADARDGGAPGSADAPSGTQALPVCSPGARKRLGLACACGAECDSGICTDGVCCNVACDQPCVSCRLPDRLGACTSVAPGSPDPRGLCTKESPETCGRNGLCGPSGCARYAPGTNCKAASCSGSSLVYPYCMPDGTCTGGSPINCAPSICAGGACKLRCTSDGDCAAGKRCVNGSCGLRGLGQSCELAEQCESGFCADGVCCDLPCKERCWSCALPSAPGRCNAVPADTPDPRAAAGVKDPAIICLDQGRKSCGMNGRCDGSGGCQRYAAGTVCQGESCDPQTNRWTPEAVCQGGVCGTAAAPRDCAPFRCEPGGARCGGGCSNNEDCQAPSVCRDGSCGKKVPGSLCTRGTECSTGHCAQGICCNTACNSTCHACNLPRTLGICTALPEGASDPSGTCKDEGERSCGTDGTCNGSGGCRKFGADIVCKPQSCTKGVKTAASLCDGAGTCVAGATVPCAPYVCNGGGTDCFSSCRGSGAECQAPNLCNNQRCGPANRGQACMVTADCASGLHCAGGVCCETACTGACRTCKRTPGTCTDLPVGTRSAGCATDAASPCGNTGTCDGKGSCSKAADTTVCATPACNGPSTGIGPAACDGAGKCPAAAPFDCGANRCLAGACLPCLKDADCLGGTVCALVTGKCTPAPLPPPPDAGVDAAPDAAAPPDTAPDTSPDSEPDSEPDTAEPDAQPDTPADEDAPAPIEPDAT